MSIPKIALWLLLTGLAAGAGAQERAASPYDTNPACTERTSNPNAPECVIPQDGEPRHAYPPKRKIAPPPPPAKPPAPAQPASPPLSPPRSGTGTGLR